MEWLADEHDAFALFVERVARPPVDSALADVGFIVHGAPSLPCAWLLAAQSLAIDGARVG